MCGVGGRGRRWRAAVEGGGRPQGRLPAGGPGSGLVRDPGPGLPEPWSLTLLFLGQKVESLDLLFGVLLNLAWIGRWTGPSLGPRFYFPVRPYFLALMSIIQSTPCLLLGRFSSRTSPFTPFPLWPLLLQGGSFRPRVQSFEDQQSGGGGQGGQRWPPLLWGPSPAFQDGLLCSVLRPAQCPAAGLWSVMIITGVLMARQNLSFKFQCTAGAQ